MKIKVPWGHIATKTVGNPNGHPVFCVHGIMDNLGTFEKLIPLLPKSFKYILLDLPGHGESSHLPPGIPYNYMDMFSFLRRVTSHLNLTKFSWLGHSLGAPLGALYSSMYPSQVDRLIMIDLVKPLTSDPNEEYPTKLGKAVDFYLQTEAKLQSTPPTYTYEDAMDRLIKGTDGHLMKERAKILMVRGTKQVGDKWSFSHDIKIKMSLIFPTTEQCISMMRGCKCPILFLKAKHSPWYHKREECDKALEIYKNNSSSFQFEMIDGNHFVHLNEPEKVAVHINPFLEKSFP